MTLLRKTPSFLLDSISGRAGFLPFVEPPSPHRTQMKATMWLAAAAETTEYLAFGVLN
jgi:hypothetical protein